MCNKTYDIDCICNTPEFILIQPTGKHELQTIEKEKDMIRNYCSETAFVSLYIDDWNAELSPWKCSGAYGNEIFEGKANETLEFTVNEIIPSIRKRYGETPKIILGGYSLAGLFSLWAGYVSEAFDGIAACSPSVWIDGWNDFAENNKFDPQFAYLSIGSKEHKTRNRMLCTVREKIERQKLLFDNDDIRNMLVINPGNHFAEPQKRTANGFIECIKMMKTE